MPRNRENLPPNTIVLDRQMFENIVGPLHKMAIEAGVVEPDGTPTFELDEPGNPTSDYARPDTSAMWFGWVLACRAIHAQVEKQLSVEDTVKDIHAAHSVDEQKLAEANAQVSRH